MEQQQIVLWIGCDGQRLVTTVPQMTVQVPQFRPQRQNDRYACSLLPTPPGPPQPTPATAARRPKRRSTTTLAAEPTKKKKPAADPPLPPISFASKPYARPNELDVPPESIPKCGLIPTLQFAGPVSLYLEDKHDLVVILGGANARTLYKAAYAEEHPGVDFEHKLEESMGDDEQRVWPLDLDSFQRRPNIDEPRTIRGVHNFEEIRVMQTSTKIYMYISFYSLRHIDRALFDYIFNLINEYRPEGYKNTLLLPDLPHVLPRGCGLFEMENVYPDTYRNMFGNYARIIASVVGKPNWTAVVPDPSPNMALYYKEQEGHGWTRLPRDNLSWMVSRYRAAVVAYRTYFLNELHELLEGTDARIYDVPLSDRITECWTELNQSGLFGVTNQIYHPQLMIQLHHLYKLYTDEEPAVKNHRVMRAMIADTFNEALKHMRVEQANVAESRLINSMRFDYANDYLNYRKRCKMNASSSSGPLDYNSHHPHVYTCQRTL